MARVRTLNHVPAKHWIWGLGTGAMDLAGSRFAGLLSDDMWWPELNGQHVRIATITRLLESYDCDVIVETGTFRGASTKFFAGFGKPVYSVEVSIRHQTVARVRLWQRSNVTLVIGESREFLRKFGEESRVSRPFFYLDAHWGESLPLREELEIIWSNFNTALVAIDDFRVPHDPGYAYDAYSSGSIDLEYCSPPPEIAVCFPALPASAETSHRRGTAYMAKGSRALAALRAGVDAKLLVEADTHGLDERESSLGGTHQGPASGAAGA